MAKQSEVELGDLVRDQITGFTGIVTAITHWLQQCDRVVVQPRDLDRDGKIKGTEGFDIPQIEILEKHAVVLDVPAKKKSSGGPRPLPTRGV